MVRRVDACVTAAVCVFAVFGHQFLRRFDDPSTEAFARDGKCVYIWYWPSLKERGDFIVKARIERQSKEAAWQRWTAMNSTGSMPPVKRFNGTEAHFMELWDARQCPPGPCGPRGAPCPLEFPGAPRLAHFLPGTTSLRAGGVTARRLSVRAS